MMKLSEDQRQSLITSLLEFVRRVSFHGAKSESEAEAFFMIVNLLLNNPVALELDLDALMKTDKSQERENSGYAQMCECGRSRCFVSEK